MTTPHGIYLEATKRGLRLEAAGDKLAVFPKGHCPPDFADTLRQHKAELLDWLEARAASLPAGCTPWLHVARQVLASEFDGCDRSTRESISIGLCSVPHPLCCRALTWLQGHAVKP